MNHPLVSVIIPNYCHAQYLNQRIDSVLNQTYDNIEVIILDDCSPDNSREIIDAYRNNPKLKHIVYNEENSGSTFIQWHKGFSLAQGELIWIAESDDYCTNDFLDCLVGEYIKSSGISIVYSHSQFVDVDGNHIWTNPKELMHKDKVKAYSGLAYIKKHLLIGNDIRNASSAIFSKDVLGTISNDYINYKAAGDRLFWIYLAEKGNVVIVKDRKNYFRQHLQKVSPMRLVDGTTFYEDKAIYDYMKKNDYINVMDKVLIYSHTWLNLRKVNFLSNDIKLSVCNAWKHLDCVPNRLLILLKNIFS